jgi:alditol oxidase
MLEKNWAGNYTYTASRLHRPTTLEALRELVVRARAIKVLGSRHSFNGIADTEEDLVSLERFDQIGEVDPVRRTVTIGAGVRYGQLAARLQASGYALHNLASLPHISVAGACATGTHGSGDRLGNLAVAVSGVELVTADSEVKAFTRERHGAEFHGVVVGLGALGAVTRLTLDVEPSYQLRQDVYRNLSLSALEAHFDEVTSSGDSVSLFTDFREERFTQVWLKRRVEPGESSSTPSTWLGATLALEPLHPLEGHDASNVTEQLGRVGPWHERLPHFRLEHTPSIGAELQSEYLVPRVHALRALRSLFDVGSRIAQVVQISEVRTVAADDLWMSPCYERDSVGIHFTWKPDWAAVRELLPILEARLEPFQARPHWGKLFSMPARRVASLYERHSDFRALVETFDPRGKFRNAFLKTHLFDAD